MIGTAVILVLVAVGFTIAEVFFPSLGAFALMAGTCILIADIMAFEHSQAVGWTFVAVEIVLVPLTVWGAFKVLPHTSIGNRMVLSGPETDLSTGAPTLEHLIGQRGEAVTDLRPAGTVQFETDRMSVVSLGGMLERGTDVVVVAVEGTEVRVRAAPANE
ncbi:MAG: NfeD family protein [Planctomycetota bacterium]|nr:NfeD family protein [Planctomycetota bacterium]